MMGRQDGHQTDQKQSDDDGHTDCISKTIDGMTQSNGLFADSHHLHSFRSTSLVFPRVCSGCQQTIPSSMVLLGRSSSGAAVQCAACQAYAHRSCAFSKTLKWSKTCEVNSSKISQANGNRRSNNQKEIHSTEDVDLELEQEQENHPERIKEEKNCNEYSGVYDCENDGEDNENYNKSTHNVTHCQSNILSIFRSIDRDKSLLDTSLEDDKESNNGGPVVSNTTMYLLRPSKSDDGILEGRRHEQQTVCSSQKSPVDASTLDTEGNNNKTRGRSDFPFFSASKLFDKRRVRDEVHDGSPIPAIQKSLTWDVSGGEECKYDENDHKSSGHSNVFSKQQTQETVTKDDSDDQDITTTQSVESQKDDDGGYRISLLGDNDSTDNENIDWFKQLSEALQENILSTFVDKLIQPRNSGISNASHDGCMPIEQSDGQNNGGGDNDDDLSSTQLRESTHDQHKGSRQIQYETPKIDTNGSTYKKIPIDDESMEGLVKEVEPKPDVVSTQKRLGIATVAGGIAGGVAGLAMAGPVGFIVGAKCGQVSGILGLLIEGSLTVGALAGGFAVGAQTGKQLQDKIEETRVLALGVGTQRKLLLVRPNIQQPEPIWGDFYKEARQSFQGPKHGLVKRLMSSETDAAKRERYERELDIVQTQEEEIPTSDKVLLLVSRTLNNKESLPGHVYRCLVQKCRQRATETSNLEGKSSVPELDVGDHGKERRKDAHAVIKYVTATLIEIRPGFASSPPLTELTATAVESLVFGEVYSYVIEEIKAEYEDRDSELRRKIASYEQSQLDQQKKGDECPKRMISDKALESLRYLPEAHSAVDKLRYTVLFLERISEFFSETQIQKASSMGADSLLKMVCQHVVVAKLLAINAEICFIEEFARDEQLLRGKEGYALVTLAAALHFLNGSSCFQKDVFDEDTSEKT